MTHHITTEYDLPITAEYRITSPGLPARLYGEPGDCYPAEPPEFEIVRVLVCGAPVPFDALPDLVREGIEEQIEMDLHDVIADEMAAAAEYRADLRRDAA